MVVNKKTKTQSKNLSQMPSQSSLLGAAPALANTYLAPIGYTAPNPPLMQTPNLPPMANTPTLGPVGLPSTSGGNAVPAVAPASSIPMSHSNSQAENWQTNTARDMNAAEREATLQRNIKAEADAKAGFSSLLDIAGESNSNPIVKDIGAMASSSSLPFIPKFLPPTKEQIPDMKIGNFAESYGYTARESSRPAGTHSARTPPPDPGKIYAMQVDNGALVANFMQPSAYQRSSARSHYQANANNYNTEGAKSVFVNVFGMDDGNISSVKPNKDVKFKYYMKGSNGRLQPIAQEQGLDLVSKSIPTAIMKLTKNIYLRDNGEDGFDSSAIQNGGGASAGKFKINALTGAGGGDYENKIYASINKAMDAMGLSVQNIKRGDPNNEVVAAFRRNPQFVATLAHGDRAIIDQFIKNQRAAVADAMFAEILGDAVGKGFANGI